MVFYGLNLVNVAKHAADFLLKSSLGAKHGLRGSHDPAGAFMLEIVFEEGLDPTKGFPSQVRRCPQAIAFVGGELVVVEVCVELDLEQEHFKFLSVARVSVGQLNTQCLPKFRDDRCVGHFLILRLRSLR